jgi:predicted nucleotidyltransferase
MNDFNEKEVRQFFSLLARHEVEYLIIGGAAVNVHGYSRSTGDLDVWYNPTQENYNRLITAIKEFGFDTSLLSDIFNDSKAFIRLPLDRFYLECLAIIDGKVNFGDAIKRAYLFNLEGTLVKVIGYDDLIQNKLMSRRAKDLEDIKQLERIRELKRKTEL